MQILERDEEHVLFFCGVEDSQEYILFEKNKGRTQTIYYGYGPGTTIYDLVK